MHYYQHHIGDFIRDTSCLTDTQSMAYLRLLWMYYESETPLVNNPKVLALRVGTDADTVSLLLEAFFKPDGDVWKHSRCDAEIEEYQALRERNKTNGKAGGRPKKTQSVSSGLQEGTETKPCRNPNHKPVTNNKPPKSPKGDSITFDVWISKCKEANESPIPEDDKVFKYIKEVGLPVEYLRLHWSEFKDRYSGQTKRYIDWKRTFLNSVKSNWFRLWFIDNNGEYLLTTQGKQAERKAA